MDGVLSNVRDIIGSKFEQMEANLEAKIEHLIKKDQVQRQNKIKDIIKEGLAKKQADINESHMMESLMMESQIIDD